MKYWSLILITVILLSGLFLYSQEQPKTDVNPSFSVIPDSVPTLPITNETPFVLGGLSDIQSGLVGFYPFDRRDVVNGAVTDRSGNGNTGYPTNIATTTFYSAKGKMAQAFNFNSDDDEVVLANESNFDFEYNQPFSICAWTNPTDTLAERPIVSKLDCNANCRGWELSTSDAGDGEVDFLLVNDVVSARIITRTQTSIPNNQWTHLCVTYNGNTTAAGSKIYFNTVSKAFDTLADNLGTNTTNATVPAVIGRRETSAGRVWYGLMDDVRIYNKELTQQEINDLYRFGISKHMRI